jgi:hypothetical protein
VPEPENLFEGNAVVVLTPEAVEQVIALSERDDLRERQGRWKPSGKTW